jgi:hypothetical protein
MSIIYRKSLKGIDEIAFKSTGLPLRMMSYLLVVDGESSVDQLAARNPQLPSLQIVLDGLREQGFLENIGTATNVVTMGNAQTANGAPVQQYRANNNMLANLLPNRSEQQSGLPPYINQFNQAAELEKIKNMMTQDVTTILGADAAQVVRKIQSSQSKDELFANMMGIKKIISIYNNSVAAEKFADRYQMLSM